MEDFESDIEEIKCGYYDKANRQFIIEVEIENQHYDIFWSKDDFIKAITPYHKSHKKDFDISKDQIQTIIEKLVMEKIEEIKNG